MTQQSLRVLQHVCLARDTLKNFVLDVGQRVKSEFFKNKLLVHADLKNAEHTHSLDISHVGFGGVNAYSVVTITISLNMTYMTYPIAFEAVRRQSAMSGRNRRQKLLFATV